MAFNFDEYRSSVDLYAFLGVKRDASDEEIKKAIRKIAKENKLLSEQGDPEALKKMQHYSDARRLLLDPEARTMYNHVNDSYGRGAAHTEPTTRPASPPPTQAPHAAAPGAGPAAAHGAPPVPPVPPTSSGHPASSSSGGKPRGNKEVVRAFAALAVAGITALAWNAYNRYVERNALVPEPESYAKSGPVTPMDSFVSGSAMGLKSMLDKSRGANVGLTARQYFDLGLLFSDKNFTKDAAAGLALNKTHQALFYYEEGKGYKPLKAEDIAKHKGDVIIALDMKKEGSKLSVYQPHDQYIDPNVYPEGSVQPLRKATIAGEAFQVRSFEYKNPEMVASEFTTDQKQADAEFMKNLRARQAANQAARKAAGLN